MEYNFQKPNLSEWKDSSIASLPTHEVHDALASILQPLKDSEFKSLLSLMQNSAERAEREYHRDMGIPYTPNSKGKNGIICNIMNVPAFGALDIENILHHYGPALRYVFGAPSEEQAIGDDFLSFLKLAKNPD